MNKEINSYSEKQSQIVDAAQKRFGIYGVEKTTMQEIAADLGMTKGSIYYYFPDKEHLYLEVIRREFNEFAATISEKLKDLSDPESMLVEYVRVRASLFRAFVNLSRFKMEGAEGMKSVLLDFWVESRVKECEIISMIFTFGIEKKILKIDDPGSMSQLFLDLLKGLRMMSLRDKQLFYIEPQELDYLVEKSVDFTRIFIKGLRTENSGNK
jgi:AcrR family transcriptional regulator